MPRRGCGCSLVLLLGAALALWGAWLTGHPDSRSLEWVARWKPAAPWVERFRASFVRSEPPASEPRHPAAPEVVVVPVAPEDYDARPRVWVPEGLELHAEPDETAEVIRRQGATSNLVVVERRAEWYRVRGPGASAQEGWVHLTGHDSGGARAAGTLPAAPLPAVAPDAETIAAALSRMNVEARRLPCGGYLLVTDADPSLWHGLCERVVAPLDEAYERVLGIAPTGQPAEAIFLFAEPAAFRSFAVEVSGVQSGYAGHARVARGYLALPVGPVGPTVRTLVHELTHLVNRRALGPALPRWLSEGTADLLGDEATPAGLGTVRGILGAEGEMQRLQAAYQARLVGSVERLVGLGVGEFDATVPSWDYEQSAFFVRYLLADASRAGAFRAYLRGLSTGAPYDPDDLRSLLGVDWGSLDRDFELWVRRAYLSPRSGAINVGPD